MPELSLLLLTCKRLLVAVHDTAPGKIVWAELDRNPVAGEYADKILSHPSRNVRQNLVLVLKLTLNIAFGSVSTTVAITSIASSFDKRYPDSARDTYPAGFLTYCVKITAPSAVTATVCSKCALKLPSSVTAVHPSLNT